MTTPLTQHVQEIGAPRILVVGDLILDQYIWGKVERISPEAPIQVLNAESEECRAGGAANVAGNLAALKARVLCAGSIGRDEAGKKLTALLKRQGVDTRAIVLDPEKPTSIKTRMVAHNQQVLRVDREKTHFLSRRVQDALLKAVARVLKSCQMVVISDYNKGTASPRVCDAIIAMAKRCRVPVIAGPKVKDRERYRGVTGATMNRSELAGLTGIDDPDRAARTLIRAWTMKFLVVTLGEKGMVLYTLGGRKHHIPTVARQVYDVTGAGDTALAAFSLMVAAGQGLEDALAVANTAAGIVVGKIGTATVTREEIVQALSTGSPHHRNKILTRQQISPTLEKHRKAQRRIVFTNGCFDLIHPGHVQTLEFAKSKGDVLIVGLNSDRSVRRLKGPARPIMSERDRAHVLASLEHVDYVVIFDEATPRDLIQRIKPDVLVKGQDWEDKSVVGSDLVLKHGGAVVLAPLIRGMSTSQIVEKIRNGKK